MLRQLPRTSRYQAALHNDDERAQFLLDAGLLNEDDSSAPYHPPLESWTQEAELLAAIVDLLQYQRADTGSINSKNHKWKKPKPTPRPESAVERVRRRNERQQHNDIAARVLGNRKK